MAIGMLTGFDKEGKIAETVFECYDHTPKVSNSVTFAGGVIKVNRFSDGSFGGSIAGIGINDSRKSQIKILTFDDFKRSGNGRWSEHERIGQKAVLEFNGPGLEEITFTMVLSTYWGVKVEEELKNLRRIRDEGIYCLLIVGDSPITENYFVLQSLNEDHKYFDGQGNLMVALTNISLKEYIERADTHGS